MQRCIKKRDAKWYIWHASWTTLTYHNQSTIQFLQFRICNMMHPRKEKNTVGSKIYLEVILRGQIRAFTYIVNKIDYSKHRRNCLWSSAYVFWCQGTLGMRSLFFFFFLKYSYYMTFVTLLSTILAYIKGGMRSFQMWNNMHTRTGFKNAHKTPW